MAELGVATRGDLALGPAQGIGGPWRLRLGSWRFSRAIREQGADRRVLPIWRNNPPTSGERPFHEFGQLADHAAPGNHNEKARRLGARLHFGVGVLVEADHGDAEFGELLGRHRVQVRDHQVDTVELVRQRRVLLDLVAARLERGAHPAGEHQILHERGYPGHEMGVSTGGRAMRPDRQFDQKAGMWAWTGVPIHGPVGRIAHPRSSHRRLVPWAATGFSLLWGGVFGLAIARDDLTLAIFSGL